MNQQVGKISRGRFLKLSSRILFWLAGLLGLVGLERFFSYQPPQEQQQVYNLGSRDAFPAEGRLLLPDIPAVVIFGNDSSRALSLLCTHLGCALEEDQEGFSCPCHGSRFNDRGEVLSGPAGRPLKELELKISPEGDLILVDEGRGS